MYAAKVCPISDFPIDSRSKITVTTRPSLGFPDRGFINPLVVFPRVTGVCDPTIVTPSYLALSRHLGIYFPHIRIVSFPILDSIYSIERSQSVLFPSQRSVHCSTSVVITPTIRGQRSFLAALASDGDRASRSAPFDLNLSALRDLHLLASSRCHRSLPPRHLPSSAHLPHHHSLKKHLLVCRPGSAHRAFPSTCRLIPLSFPSTRWQALTAQLLAVRDRRQMGLPLQPRTLLSNPPPCLPPLRTCPIGSGDRLPMSPSAYHSVISCIV